MEVFCKGCFFGGKANRKRMHCYVEISVKVFPVNKDFKDNGNML